jgi:hypothetical protein
MDGTPLFFLSSMVDSVLILAGHGYDFSGSAPSESGGDDGGGGIGTGSIMAVLVLGLVTVGLLVWLNARDSEPGSGSRFPALKLGSVAPVALIAAVIATPLVLWTASSESDEKRLIVERWTSVAGDPELLISLGAEDLNQLETTNGRKSVRLECRGRDGETVLVARQKWPLIKERGYAYPHAHQKASPEQVRRADRCRLRGTTVALSAGVKGALKD